MKTIKYLHPEWGNHRQETFMQMCEGCGQMFEGTWYDTLCAHCTAPFVSWEWPTDAEIEAMAEEHKLNNQP